MTKSLLFFWCDSVSKSLIYGEIADATQSLTLKSSTQIVYATQLIPSDFICASYNYSRRINIRHSLDAYQYNHVHIPYYFVLEQLVVLLHVHSGPFDYMGMSHFIM